MKKTNNIGNQTGPNNPPSIVMSEDKISSTDTKIEVNTYAMKKWGDLFTTSSLSVFLSYYQPCTGRQIAIETVLDIMLFKVSSVSYHLRFLLFTKSGTSNHLLYNCSTYYHL